MADRWAYIPLIGIFIIISWGVPGFLGKWRYKEISLATIAAIILIILSTTTWFQARHWQNGITIFKHTVDVTQNNCVANCELGHALMRNGKLDDAVIQFYNALRINPNHEEAHANLGYTLACQGKVKDAIYHYNKTLRINRDNVKTHNNLGVLLAGKGKFNEAFYHYQEALRINPKYAGAYYNLGKIYANKGKIEDAILYYKKTLQVSPNMPAALYNLSWIGATSEDDKFRSSIKAVELAEKLCKLQNYTQPLSLDTLAAAYAEAGRFKEAVLTAKKGLALALEMGPKELALGLENRLKLYHAGRPYRQNSHK
jgi:tetratricopeptide (TPR) repeat protein